MVIPKFFIFVSLITVATTLARAQAPTKGVRNKTPVKKEISAEEAALKKYSSAANSEPGPTPLLKKGPSIQLSPKDAADLVLRRGIRTKEVNFTYQGYAFDYYKAVQPYDWNLTFQSGFEKDRTENSGLWGNDPNTERQKTSVSLTKNFLSGTKTKLDYTRNSQKFIYPVNTFPITYDLGTFSIEQSLLRNFFGLQDRAIVHAAEIDYEAQKILRINELQDLVLNTLRQFWITYVAEENFKEALAAKERYEKLVSVVRRKNSVGYSNPGEFTQIQAEYEARLQTVKTTSVDYLKSMDDLQTLLNLEPGTEIIFIIPTELPPAPKLIPMDLQKRRPVVSQILKAEAAQERLRSAKNGKLPDINFVGELGGTGLDDKASVALNQLTTGSHPRYYAGLKFAYYFGSDYQAQSEFYARSNSELTSARLERQALEEKDLQAQVERQVTSAYAVAQSKKLQREYREKATQELTRSYNQGRTDISILIDAMNKYFLSEVEYARSIGDYQIALNQWAAARDELIPNTKEDK